MPGIPLSAAREPEESADGPAADRWGRDVRSRLYGWAIFFVARLLFRTLRLKFINQHGLGAASQGGIFVTWHGRSLIPANVFRNRGYWALISLSRDGEIQNNIFRRFGFQTVRGSTGRGGVKAALQMARKVRDGAILAFTPDGPRGPSHRVQLGVILMAQKSGTPIIPLGISAQRRWLTRSWDSYMIPKPFSKVYFLVGDPIYVSASIDDAERDRVAADVERAINRLEREAERLAGFPEYPPSWPTE